MVDIVEVFKEFNTKNELIAFKKFGNGHINSTYLIFTDDKKRYILQRINTVAFKDVDLLMNNISLVTHHLKNKKFESIEMLNAKNGKLYVEVDGEYFRMYQFIDNTLSFEKPKNYESVCIAASAFGKFHNNLGDLDATLLGETIPHFHDTPKRYRDLLDAIEKDTQNRVKNVKREIEIVQKYTKYLSYITDGINSGEVKLHITHNDPKINNALFDEVTNDFRLVIDLDTVMPGSILYDFGDALRSLFTGDNEDSKEYEKVVVNPKIYENYLRAYFGETKSMLTKKEIELFPYAPFILTIECGMRFLEDYLKGDVYFSTAYPEHNLDRARTQLNLAESIMKNIDELKEITLKVTGK